jgi:hypothetical protein
VTALVGDQQPVLAEIGCDQRPAAAAVRVTVQQKQRLALRVAKFDVGKAKAVRQRDLLLQRHPRGLIAVRRRDGRSGERKENEQQQPERHFDPKHR